MPTTTQEVTKNWTSVETSGKSQVSIQSDSYFCIRMCLSPTQPVSPYDGFNLRRDSRCITLSDGDLIWKSCPQGDTTIAVTV